jgi:transcriptional regulator with XRE-family HTH domain
MSTVNPLKRYLRRTGLSQRQFAIITESQEGQVSAWVRGLRRPSLDEAFRLEAATKGAVPASAWTNHSRAA